MKRKKKGTEIKFQMWDVVDKLVNATGTISHNKAWLV